MTFALTRLIETTISGQDIVYDSQAEIDNFFILTQGPGSAGFPAPVSYTHLTLPTNREV